jgi:hypothetical protein
MQAFFGAKSAQFNGNSVQLIHDHYSFATLCAAKPPNIASF